VGGDLYWRCTMMQRPENAVDEAVEELAPRPEVADVVLQEDVAVAALHDDDDDDDERTERAARQVFRQVPICIRRLRP